MAVLADGLCWAVKDEQGGDGGRMRWVINARLQFTFAYNLRSTGLYLRNEMYPRVPLYLMAAAALPVDLDDAGHEAEDIEPAAKVPGWLGEIDDAVLGFRRNTHHGFLLGSGTARGLRVKRAGRTAGYAYAMPNGRLGPLAVAPGTIRRRSSWLPVPRKPPTCQVSITSVTAAGKNTILVSGAPSGPRRGAAPSSSSTTQPPRTQSLYLTPLP